LDWSPLSREPRENGGGIAQKAEREQAGMIEQPLDCRDRRSEREVVTGRQRRWQRSVLGGGAVIARPKRNRNKPGGIAK
jgi:hypothetical protein